jgi:hypothetical protein
VKDWARVPDLIIRDLVLVGFAGGVIAALIGGEIAGWSFMAACLWLALNFSLLAWLLGGFFGGQRPSCLFIIILVCAKIPASYFLLYWLYRADYLDVLGLTAGILVLPVVLVFRGLTGRPRDQVTEED